MVAPTRQPQARGIKCELCKKILAAATWLDQTKLAKSVTEAQQVLNLIKVHDTSECPCIPKDIQNLLVGSTYFELHRLIAKALDYDNHAKQCSQLRSEVTKKFTSHHKQQSRPNDLPDQVQRESTKFKLFSPSYEQKDLDRLNLQFKYLCRAIDYWKLAVEDQANPFNSKLALRLGLSHHTIYACYLFKYHKLLDYQLITANLLVNLFKAIEGITVNAQLHAYFLLIRALIDCSQLKLARQNLKIATKYPNCNDKSHYESILIACVECELNLIDKVGDETNSLAELASLSKPLPDDKLQHYYARNLGLSIVIRYIQSYSARSELCHEFYHSLNIIGAIVRRCFEDTYGLMNYTASNRGKLDGNSESPVKSHVIDHSWIRYAVCDYAFSTMNLLTDFLIRAGTPELLDLYYNYLSLVAHRTFSCYWQARIAAIGSNLDALCDKHDHASKKLETMTKIIGLTSDSYQMNLLRLDLDINQLFLMDKQKTAIKNEVFLDLERRLDSFYQTLTKKLSKIHMIVVIGRTNQETHSLDFNEPMFDGHYRGFAFMLFKLAIQSKLASGDKEGAKEWVEKLIIKLETIRAKTLEYNEHQRLLEILIAFANVDESHHMILDVINSPENQLFLQADQSNSILNCQEEFSKINIQDHGDQLTRTLSKRSRSIKSPPKSRHSKISPIRCKTKKSQLTIGRSKKSYQVSNNEQEYLVHYNVLEAFDNFNNLTEEELVITYLRNCEPNPDYLVYRRAHELMFTFRLKDRRSNQLQLLYHFCESVSSNTLRYTWMMFESQNNSLVQSKSEQLMRERSKSYLKQLGFANILANSERSIKSFINSIPENYDLVQMKYMFDSRSAEEHLLIVRFDNKTGSSDDPIYLRASRSVMYSDDFFEDAKLVQKGINPQALALPNRIVEKLDEANKALTISNHNMRTEKRQTLEKELGIMLRERLENDWLGPMRFVLCGKVVNNPSYSKFIRDSFAKISDIMRNYRCKSLATLRIVIENAPEFSREEFCRLISALFTDSTTIINEARESFNLWLKSFEVFLSSTSQDRIDFLRSIRRGHIGLIMDQTLDQVPIESLPVIKRSSQGLFRIPSLRLFSVMMSREHSTEMSSSLYHNSPNPKELFYILDPNNDLPKTRQLFETKLRNQKSWAGSIGHAPNMSDLEEWLATKEIYLYIGHGAGTVHYNKLRNGSGLSSIPHVRPLSIVMGCSSGKMISHGPKLESQSIVWTFLFRGGPAYVGLLWDVTDVDIDSFLDSTLSKWIGPSWLETDLDQRNKLTSGLELFSLAEAMTKSRNSCRRYEFLVGASPVLYGLPLWYGR